jgi:hypothetical protein
MEAVRHAPFLEYGRKSPPRRAALRLGAVRLGLGEWRRQDMPSFLEIRLKVTPLVALRLALMQCGLLVHVTLNLEPRAIV